MTAPLTPTPWLARQYVASRPPGGFWFPTIAALTMEIAEAMLQGLFAPICRDYQRWRGPCRAMPSDSVFTPR